MGADAYEARIAALKEDSAARAQAEARKRQERFAALARMAAEAEVCGLLCCFCAGVRRLRLHTAPVPCAASLSLRTKCRLVLVLRETLLMSCSEPKPS